MSDLKMKVRDQEYEVAVEVTHDGKNAWFRLDLGEGKHPLSSHTWEGLYTQAMAATKRAKVKVSVPVLEYVYRGNTWREGSATGIHAGTGNVMITWNLSPTRTSNEQVSKYGSTYFAALT